jgi:predicted permease
MSWIGRLFGRQALERDLDKELQFHLDAAVADHMRSGLTRDAAIRLARIEIGGLEQVKEYTRDSRGTRWVEDLLGDVRYALRGMARSPAFSAAAVLTLAVGIGANTAIWSIVEALMLRALPIERPNELYAIRRAGNEEGSYLVSHTRFRRLAAELPDSTKIAAMAGFARMYAALGESPEPVNVQLVSGDWFAVAGVRAQLGRLITPADDRTLGGHPVAVLGHGFWTTRFGADRNIVGKTVRVNGLALTVIGVAEEEFQSLTVAQPVAMWVPLVEQHELRYKGNSASDNADTELPWIPQAGIAWLTLVTRTDPSAAAAIERRLDARYRTERKEELASTDSTSREYAMREHLVLESISKGFSPLRQFYRDPLKVLMGSVGLILLIACGNLASLMLARASARGHEMAVRVSLGAQRGRLIRQVLTESVTLAVLGGAFSLLVAKWGTAVLLKAASTGPRAVPLDVTLGWKVLSFAIGVSLVTGVLFGLAPALRIARADLYETFRSGGRVFGRGAHRLPLGRVLVVSQIALSLVLVTSAGLFVRTLRNLLSINPGYETQKVLAARIDVRAAGYTYAQLPALHDRLISAVAAVQGVRSASLSLNGFASNTQRWSGFTVPGRVLPPQERTAQENFVSPAFFETAGVPIVRGRPFNATDRAGGARVAILSQTAAKHFFGTDDVVGKRIGHTSTPEFEVVGVVPDARVNNIRETPKRLIFYPLTQGPQEYIQSVEARITGPTDASIAAIKRAVAEVDRNLPLREVTTIQELLERGLTRERLVARLAGSFGILALLLAGIGLYGVVGYSVSRRTNEMGVRLALGASPTAVGWLVVRDSLATIAIGLVCGLALWFPLAKLSKSLVYGIEPRDLMTVVSALTLLVAVGSVAALLPALRASRVNPVEAIRAE